ncbi:L-selectin [Nibea albiflora]|uniref:L-selectin n=1 Tax=Nibea albiflora TaxID=240163 RepID=A0ACB7F393_NIBAL|nr:L-selectin [Nibea albiflora]
MGCSSGRQPPAPVLHPDLDCGNSSEANTLPQDSENQNQGLNGCGEGGEGEGSVGRDPAKPPESLPTLERLAQATGGTEKSWYRCVFPFGVISLVIGMAGTGLQPPCLGSEAGAKCQRPQFLKRPLEAGNRTSQSAVRRWCWTQNADKQTREKEQNSSVLKLRARGLCAVSSHAGRQYHFVYEPKTWTEAQSYCREKYTDLATIDSVQDMNILNSMVDLSKVTTTTWRNQIWIGLQVKRDSWMWSLSNKGFYKHGETEFRNWQDGQPTSIGSGRHCTFMDESGRWNCEDCERSYKSVCMYVKGSNVTFFFINKTMTWTKAQNYCRTKYTDLASVRNMTENQKIQDLKDPEERAWIGLSRDSWKWSDGSYSSFRYWKNVDAFDNAQEQLCVTAHFEFYGMWMNMPCTLEKGFICYSLPSKRVIKVRVSKKTSGQDLNEPAVMEQMLQKLRQRLKDQGVNPDTVKLSWRKQADGKVFHKVEKKTEKKTKKTEL